MKHIVLLLLLLASVFAHAQQFKLKPINKAQISKAMADGREDEIYVYLEQNYKTVGKRTGVKLDDEFESKPICAFTQKFENGIVYKTHGCGEAAGLEVIVTFPETGTKDVKKWVEDLYGAPTDGIKNVWDKTGLIYGPEDEGAGCYYTIKQSGKSTIVEMWCGC